MLTENELTQGYETEIQYQKHMIENLGRWFSLLFIIASLGGILIYFFFQKILLLFILGVIVAIVGILGMFFFGYGIYKGRQNVNKVIDDFETKLHAYK
jgi:VIT1/CCC1 family predicted Fe2+/Mn2+ transporter